MKRYFTLIALLLVSAYFLTGCFCIDAGSSVFGGLFDDEELTTEQTEAEEVAAAVTEMPIETETETESEAETETATETEPITETEPEESVDTEAILLNALHGTYPVVTERGGVAYLPEYLKLYYNATMDAYAFVDFGNDGQKEMVIMSAWGYIVLHCADQDVFAFGFDPRSMLDLKEDGSFCGSAGASSSVYCTLRFNGGRYVLQEEASADDDVGYYMIDGRACSRDDMERFLAQWHSKKEAEWIWLTDSSSTGVYTQTSYLQRIPTGEQIYAGPGYDYSVTMVLDEGGTFTIVEEYVDSYGVLWGKLKSGIGWVNLTNIRANEN